MDASQISVENIAAIVGVGLVSAWLAAKKYLAERKAPAQESADLALLAGSITDMRPVREMKEDMKRLADAAEGILAILRARQAAEAAADEDELRDRIRDLERSLADAGRPSEPRRRR
jgi:hypothetical protein